MQYVGKVGGYVYNQWNALNPATLLGAIDIIVIEQPDGSLHCSPWHVRFGKFQIIKPLQKKIDLYVNDIRTDLPMKLGEGGEAFFVFETSNRDLVSKSVITSPVVSACTSLEGTPASSPKPLSSPLAFDLNAGEPDMLDLNADGKSVKDDIEERIKLSDSSVTGGRTPPRSPSSAYLKLAIENAKKVSKKLNIPSKIDDNGDIVLDMDGYKPNAQKNIDVTDEFFHKNFLKELVELTNANNEFHLEDLEYNLWDQIVRKDKDGNIRILNNPEDQDGVSIHSDSINTDGLTRISSNEDGSFLASPFKDSGKEGEEDKTYFKTLRLTSEQLQKMNLHYGKNTLTFKLAQGTSQVVSNLFLWKATTPIVISDIDGTITKSDALGHVLTLIGKDWTHPGVAHLFQDIRANGYNIVYLTARSVGQADSTRQYLQGILQDGVKLPSGPVVLSPDRTMAALRREVILKKPEVFKMSCLNDIKSLYFNNDDDTENGVDERTPFYAGFGNRITDAVSYRSVQIPSHRIFTINPNGEVHMELLELAGYKSSYLHIGELVDHFFPPIKEVSALNSYWNDNQFNQYLSNTHVYSPPASPGVRSVHSVNEDMLLGIKTDEKYNDVNYWRDPLPSLSDLSDVDDDDTSEATQPPRSPILGSFRNQAHESWRFKSPERPSSVASFSTPLKNFMMFNHSDSKLLSTAGSRPDLTTPAKSPLPDPYPHPDPDYDDEDDDEVDDDYDEDDDDDYTDDDEYDDADDYELDNEEDLDEEDDDYDLDDDTDPTPFSAALQSVPATTDTASSPALNDQNPSAANDVSDTRNHSQPKPQRPDSSGDFSPEVSDDLDHVKDPAAAPSSAETPSFKKAGEMLSNLSL